MTKQLRPGIAPISRDIDRFRSLQEEVCELMKIWKQVKGYDERSFITAKISDMQIEALNILERWTGIPRRNGSWTGTVMFLQFVI